MVEKENEIKIETINVKSPTMDEFRKFKAKLIGKMEKPNITDDEVQKELLSIAKKFKKY